MFIDMTETIPIGQLPRLPVNSQVGNTLFASGNPQTLPVNQPTHLFTPVLIGETQSVWLLN